jgi:integrase
MSLISQPSFNLSLKEQELVKKTLEYESAALSPNTLRSYKSMWKKFESWCCAASLTAIPASAETVALYISSLGEDVSFSTLDSTLAAIEAVHKKANLVIQGDHAFFRRVRKGIRRKHKGNQTLKQAPALTILDLKGVCCRLGNGIKDVRDKSVITLAFFGALRRSEVVALDVDNIQLTEKGMMVTILQSKTSDKAQNVYIAYAKDKDICPVTSFKKWLEIAGIAKGPVFRSLIKGGKISADRLSGHSVSEIIKNHFGDDYSGHSTRRGLVTASAEKGTSLHVIKKHSRHKSADMILHYIEDTKGFDDSAVTVLGV